MKIGVLRAIAHNVADSLGSGIGLLIGVCEMDIFGEAKKSPGGVIGVDFLSGEVAQGKVSPALKRAIAKYRNILPALCAKHGASIDDFKTLTARYSILNRRTLVTVQDRIGRCFVDEYVGTPARHIKVTDHLGRVRTKRGRVHRLRVIAEPSK